MVIITWESGFTGIYWIETRAATNPLTFRRKTPPNKNCLTKNVSSMEAEGPYLNGNKIMSCSFFKSTNGFSLYLRPICFTFITKILNDVISHHILLFPPFSLSLKLTKLVPQVTDSSCEPEMSITQTFPGLSVKCHLLPQAFPDCPISYYHILFSLSIYYSAIFF